MNKVRKVVPFKIEGAPVNVHSEPTSYSPVINAIAPGTEIVVVAEEKGYLKLLYGGYVMRSSHTILDEDKIRQERGKQILQGKIKNIKLKKGASLKTFGSSPFATANVRIKDSATTDSNGDPINDNQKGDNQIWSVMSINASNRTVHVFNPSDPSQQKTVSFDDAEFGDPSDAPASSTGEATKVTYTDIDAYTANKGTSVADIGMFGTTLQWVGESASGAVQNLITKASEFLKPEDFKIENTRSVFGMPYQFTPITDLRTDDTMDDARFGRKYAQKIVSRAPILIMQAGRPVFLKGFNDDQKKSISENLASGATTSDLEKTLNSEGKYYSFEDASVSYYRAVTQMCRAMGALLGLNNREITTSYGKTTVHEVDWMRASEKPYWGYYKGAVGFYVNSEAQMQDSISNGTRQSALVGQVNQISDQAAEMQFILGGVAGAGIPGLSSLANEVKEKTGQDAAAKKAGDKDSTENTGVVGSLINNINTLMAGGKLIFPEIWSDSSFTKNYNITIKLDSPDCDTMSIYMNILVPLAHILGFCMPRYSGTNAYVSPFIVRAYLRSMFHVDMGIITNCDIIKGDNQAWNQDGLPTQVTVQMTIKDLYSVMAMLLSKENSSLDSIRGDDLIGNPAQLDYIGNLCGINVAVPDFGRTMALWYAIRNPATAFTDGVGRAFTGIATAVNSTWQNLFNSHFSM